MENPASWGEAERVVSIAIREHGRQMEDRICGFSLERMIVDALRQAGLLHECATVAREEEE